MKTIKKIMMAMFVMACMGLTVSCDKDNDDDGGNGNDNNYSTLIQGTWQIDHATSDGQDIMPLVGRIQLTFNANGTGLMNDGGQTENNGFNWSISGNVITITTTHGGVQMNFNILNMTSTECTFSGAAMELDGHMLQNVEIHIVKVGGGDNPGPNPDDNNYSTLILGNWQITTAMLDGQDLAGQMGSLILSFYAGGTGLINHDGVTENNDFGWSISGNTITITPRGGSYQYTITSLNETTCTFTGNVFPVTGQQGNVSITMTKVNGDNPDPGPVTGSLEGTMWNYHLDTTMTESESGMTITSELHINLKLEFTTTTSGAAQESVTYTTYFNGVPDPDWSGSENNSAPFTYTYSENTHTGVITATATDPDTGDTETTIMNFTYNPSDNTIIVVNTDYDPEEDMMPQTMVFQRIRK